MKQQVCFNQIYVPLNYSILIVDMESEQDDSQSVDIAAVAASMPSLDLFSKY
jgi:hypothetical protein